MKTFKEFLSIAEQQVIGPTRQVPRMAGGKPVVPVNIQPDRKERRLKAYKEVTTEAAALAIPAAMRLAPLVPIGIKLVGSMMKTQGDTARPRTPNVQRPSGKITAAEKQKRQAREDRRAQAADRAREREAEASKKIDDLIGSDADRRYAARGRSNQPQIQRELRKKLRRQETLKRMEDAAKKLGLD